LQKYFALDPQSSDRGSTAIELVTLLRLLALFRRESTFVERDIRLLSKHFLLTPLQWNYVTGPFRLAKVLSHHDLVYSWFAGPHSAAAALLAHLSGAKTLVMLGGFDCVRIPEINYGAFLNPVRASTVRTAVRLSDRVAAVDPSLVDDLRQNFPTTVEIRVMPTGYDSREFYPVGDKEPMILTVGDIDESAALRKGLYTFAKVAAELRDLTFVLAGKIRSIRVARVLKRASSDRLVMIGPLGGGELLRYYQRSRVYCQLSRHEGLPNAVCEAMLCECVPVGTHFGGIPTAIGTTGQYCRFGDVEDTCRAIRSAMRMTGSAARTRIQEFFPIGRRERELVGLLNEMAKDA